MEEALAAARRAVAESEAVRASLRRRYPPNRDRLLSDQMFALAHAREPLRLHLLRAPKATPRNFAPDVRAASEAITRERRRVDRMLNGKWGREGWYRGPRKKLVPVSHLSGTVRQAKGVLASVEARESELAAIERILSRPGLPMDKLFAFTSDARGIRDDAKKARLRVAKAQQRVKQSQAFAPRPPANLAKFDAQADDMKAKLKQYEQRAARAARATPAKPLTRREAWTRAHAVEALDTWAKGHEGRWPTARELPSYPQLPSRGTLGTLGISLAKDHTPAT